MLGEYLLHSDASPRVRAEQIRAIAGHIPIIAVGTVVAAAVIWFLLHDVVRSGSLTAWCIGIAVLLALRLLHYRHFLKLAHNVDSVLASAAVFVGMALVSGALWALLPPLFIQGDDAFVLIGITIILIGMTTGSLASEAVFIPVFLAFTMPVILSLSTTILILGEKYDYLGLLGYGFFTALIGFALRSGRAQQKSFELRFENLELVEDLSAQKREAEQANLAKSRFLAAASHDLRQPLHALGFYLESLKLESLKSERGSDRQRELVAKIDSANDALVELFQSLLDISRLDAGVVEAACQDFALGDLLDRLEDRFRPLADDKGIALRISHHDEITRSDPVLLERILDNLISNAVRYTGAGEVRVNAFARGDELIIEVRDTGPGIPEFEHESVFDEFHQLGNPGPERGLGLGLAIVKRLCRLMNCRLDLESALGTGSCFSIGLETGKMPSQDAGESAGQGVYRPQTDSRILVLEDEVTVREAMRNLLGEWGYSTVCVKSGEEALSRIDAGYRPDLLISDYHLDDSCKGIDAIHAILARLDRAAPVILVTGDTSPDRLRQARAVGFTLLHKPVNPAQLRMAINQKILAKAEPVQAARLS